MQRRSEGKGQAIEAGQCVPSVPEDVKLGGVTLAVIYSPTDVQMHRGERNGPKNLDMELTTMKCWFVLSGHENAYIVLSDVE